jgi:hypothetical protein
VNLHKPVSPVLFISWDTGTLNNNNNNNNNNSVLYFNVLQEPITDSAQEDKR